MTTALRLDLTKVIAAIAILIFIALTAILVHPVLAQETSTKTPSIRKDKMATREAAFKAKLEKFKDKKKAEIAERVNTNLNKINQKQTAQMLKHLDKMSVILDKLEARVLAGSPDIKDSTAAKAAIAAARSSIASATATVKLQAEKDYTLTVTSESKVKVDAQKARDQLRTDLQALRIQVIEVKQSVGNTIRVAKSGKVEVPREGTPSGQ